MNNPPYTRFDNSSCPTESSSSEALEESIRTHGWKSAGVPKLGCGLGGLEWPAVREVLEDAPARAARTCVITLYGPKR